MLLWGLHLGFGWLVLGLGAYALAAVGGPVLATDALHLVLVGGAGTLTLSIMMRLIRAHARLPQTGGRCEAVILALMNAAAAARGLVPVLLPGWRPEAGILGMTAWTAAFTLTLSCYAPILGRPAPLRARAARGRPAEQSPERATGRRPGGRSAALKASPTLPGIRPPARKTGIEAAAISVARPSVRFAASLAEPACGRRTAPAPEQGPP